MAKRNFSPIIGIFTALLLFYLKTISANRTSFYLEEVRSLSELPMAELIHIKSSLIDEEDFTTDDEHEEASSRTLSVSLPVAQPLKRMNKKSIRRYEDHYDEKGKDSKISKIFQLSVTALSFLAFGGYLLTLIITTIRQNSGTNGNGNVIVLSNLQGLQNYNRPRRNVRILDPAENEFEMEKLYRGMIMLSRTYAAYN
ncbi:uncharacterized protein LOC114872786 [Osmia bicornis bicornis]|uniref:uncharacterized protein LOC114872786 n=1 Tax=Osmia bicornis bicornis TaxID=1437191 RepID=UPI0010F69762|nr:uncharacterized protein LOC114872786 [Osmia bicornis bicornis]